MALVQAIVLALAAGAAAPSGDPVADRIAAIGAELEGVARAPRAAALLAELEAIDDDAPDLSKVAALYARVADDAGAPPELQAFARIRLAAVERARGNLGRQAAQLKRLGFVTGWRAIGPFDDEGKRGLAELHPPEKELELAAVYPGKGGEAAWREVPPDAGDLGFVPLGAALPSEKRACAHALAVLESPAERPAALWFGGSGAARVLVNGAVALEERRYHPAHPDQRGALVALRKGPNRIQVKLCNQEERMGFFLRLVDGRGAPLALPQPAGLPPPVAAGARPVPLTGLVDRLDELAAAAAREPGPAARLREARARLDLARVGARIGPWDREERRPLAEARRSAELAPALVEARLLAAELEEDGTRRRAQLDAALAAAPADPRVLAAVALDLAARARPHAAVPLLKQALARAPRFAAAHVQLARALEAAGLEAEAARAAAAAAALLPTVPSAVVEAARFARRLGRLDEAAWLCRKALALRLDDVGSRAALVQLLLDRGDVDGAVALLVEGLRVVPGQADATLRLADLLAANGRTDDAEARYAEALRLAPGSAEGWERRGKARLRAGRQAEALADLQRARALEPQRPGLKDRIRLLEPKREPFEAPYALDAAALAKGADDGGPDDDAVILGEVHVTRLHRTGLASRWTQEVVRIRTQRGVEDWRRRAFSYAPDRQDVEVVRVRVVKPDGTTTETWDESETSESEPWYRLYYDTRVKTLVATGLAPGDVLELAWRVDDTARENLLADSWGDFERLDGAHASRRFDYVVIAPAGRGISSNAPAGVTRTERALPDGLVEHRWSAGPAPRIEPEPGMPPPTEVGRFLHLSTFSSWEEVGEFYRGLVRDPLRLTPEVREAAERIAAAALPRRSPGKPPTREEAAALVRAVYGFVVTQVRYVGLEFGIHGYKPYAVDQVLQRRFGDCKDKASLMHALLEALGIDSRLVLLRMKRLGNLPEAPASLVAFNHAILYVPALDLWLDGTASYTGSRELPAEDRGANVLVIEPEGPARYGRIPEARPEENVVAYAYDVALAAGGAATLDGRSTIAGEQAGGYRRSYEAAAGRRAALEQAFGRTWPSTTVEAVETTPAARIEEPVALSFRLRIPSFARADAGGLRFSPFGNARSYTERWGALAERRFPLVAGDPNELRFTYRVALPAGWEPTELPEPAAVDGPDAAFELRYAFENGRVVATGRILVKRPRVAVGEYAGFRALAAALDEAMARTVRVAPAPRKGTP
jgi:tetratricopeptide (TPR) repeat protein/transglutaminase-like putative cysteine protease